jgi:uncharacterized protein (DUF1800 family)
MKAKRASLMVIVFAGLFQNSHLLAQRSVLEAMRASPLTKEQLVEHAANRLGYGVSPVNSILPHNMTNSLEADNWISTIAGRIEKDITTPYSLGYHPDLKPFIKALSTTIDGHVIDPTLTNDELIAIFTRYSGVGTQEAKITANRILGSVRFQTKQMKVLKAALGSQFKGSDGKYQDGQINNKEVLQEFWFNHFNVHANKAHLTIAGRDTYEHTIHSKMYTTFYELLSSVIKSPAMLYYLDNTANRIIKEGSYVASNQNLGRELLELHTLGMGPSDVTSINTYSQKDVEETSRILAGHNTLSWKYVYRPANALRNQYIVNGTVVDQTPSVMKTRFSTEGPERLEDLLKFLANHPQTKKNICRKLVNIYVSSGLVEPVLGKCTRAWGDGGNLKAMYRSIITSNEFWSVANYRTKIKNPLELVISQVRHSGLSLTQLAARPIIDDIDNKVQTVSNSILNEINKFGLDLRFYLEPTGYPTDGGSWVSKHYFASVGRSSFMMAHLLDTANMSWALSQDLTSRERIITRTVFNDLYNAQFNAISLNFKYSGVLSPGLSRERKTFLTCILASDPSVFTLMRAPASSPAVTCEAEGSKLNKREFPERTWTPSLLQTARDIATSTNSILFK